MNNISFTLFDIDTELAYFLSGNELNLLDISVKDWDVLHHPTDITVSGLLGQDTPAISPSVTLDMVKLGGGEVMFRGGEMTTLRISRLHWKMLGEASTVTLTAEVAENHVTNLIDFFREHFSPRKSEEIPQAKLAPILTARDVSLFRRNPTLEEKYDLYTLRGGEIDGESGIIAELTFPEIATWVVQAPSCWRKLTSKKIFYPFHP